MTKKILLIITIFFFAGMLFLTFFAEQMHNASLPRVTAAHPEQRSFSYEYTLEDGTVSTGSVQKTAVPKVMADSGVYVIYSAEKNGTKRNFVRLADIETGEEQDGYVEVISGIMFSERIVTESSEELKDGAEVTIR